MLKRIDEAEWDALRTVHPFINANFVILNECRDEFGTVDLFAIAGAADLVDHHIGGTVLHSTSRIRRRCIKTFAMNHPDRFQNIAGAYRAQMLKRAQIFGVIKHLIADIDGMWGHYNKWDYIEAMDAAELWDVVWDAGADCNAEFETVNPVPPRRFPGEQPQYGYQLPFAGALMML